MGGTGPMGAPGAQGPLGIEGPKGAMGTPGKPGAPGLRGILGQSGKHLFDYIYIISAFAHHCGLNLLVYEALSRTQLIQRAGWHG